MQVAFVQYCDFDTACIFLIRVKISFVLFYRFGTRRLIAGIRRAQHTLQAAFQEIHVLMCVTVEASTASNFGTAFGVQEGRGRD